MDALKEKYQVYEQELGEGTYGCVFAGVRKSDAKHVAVKLCRHVSRLFNLHGQRVPAEVVMLDRVSSRIFDGVAHMLDFYKCRDDEWLIVTERPAECQDLYDYIAERELLSEDVARRFMVQVMAAVRHCHDRGLVHMDLKPENIIVDLRTERIKLIDFGAAQFISNEAQKIFPGTRVYRPPESIFSPKVYHLLSAEIWGLGVLLYQMVHYNLPFLTDDDMYKPPPLDRELSDPCKEFIVQCLHKDPKRRPSLDMLCDHQWIAGSESVSEAAKA